jgi:cobalt-zinc-cadmium efflux system protein
VIVLGTWNLFKQSLHLLFDGVPDSVDLLAVQTLLEELPGVARVHDLHVWAMGTSEIAMTAHLVMPDGQADDAFLEQATQALHAQFDIAHATLQVVRVPFTQPCATWTRGSGNRPPGQSGRTTAAQREELAPHDGHSHR